MNRKELVSWFERAAAMDPGGAPTMSIPMRFVYAAHTILKHDAMEIEAFRSENDESEIAVVRLEGQLRGAIDASKLVCGELTKERDEATKEAVYQVAEKKRLYKELVAAQREARSSAEPFSQVSRKLLLEENAALWTKLAVKDEKLTAQVRDSDTANQERAALRKQLDWAVREKAAVEAGLRVQLDSALWEGDAAFKEIKYQVREKKELRRELEAVRHIAARCSAEPFSKVASKLLSEENTKLQRDNKDLRNRVEDLQSSMTGKNERLTAQVRELAAASHERTHLRKDLDAANKRAYKIAQTASRRKADLNKIESELSSLFGLTGADIDTMIAAVKHSISEYEDALKEARLERAEQRTQLTSELDMLERENVQLIEKRNNTEIDARYQAEYQAERDGLREQLDKEIEKNMRHARVEDSSTETGRLRYRLHNVEIERNKLRMKLQGTKNNARSIEKDRDMLLSERKQTAQKHRDLSNMFAKTEMALADITKERNKLQEDCNELSHELCTANKAENAESRREIMGLENLYGKTKKALDDVIVERDKLNARAISHCDVVARYQRALETLRQQSKDQVVEVTDNVFNNSESIYKDQEALYNRVLKERDTLGDELVKSTNEGLALIALVEVYKAEIAKLKKELSKDQASRDRAIATKGLEEADATRKHKADLMREHYAKVSVLTNRSHDQFPIAIDLWEKEPEKQYQMRSLQMDLVKAKTKINQLKEALGEIQIKTIDPEIEAIAARAVPENQRPSTEKEDLL